jgi:hypothetical protein
MQASVSIGIGPTLSPSSRETVENPTRRLAWRVCLCASTRQPQPLPPQGRERAGQVEYFDHQPVDRDVFGSQGIHIREVPGPFLQVGRTLPLRPRRGQILAGREGPVDVNGGAYNPTYSALYRSRWLSSVDDILLL